MTDLTPSEIVRWALLLPKDGPIIVLVVDDADDDAIVTAVAQGDEVPSGRFGGLWGTGERDGCWLVGFHLIKLGGGMERQWFTDNIHRELLDAVLTVPHLVAIMPQEIAGDANTADEIVPRLGGSLLVEITDRSPQVAQVLAERDDRARRRP